MKIDSLFEEHFKNLEYFFSEIDKEQVEKVLQQLVKCKGAILFAGVGKSGIIAEKVAKTLLSTGTKSFYLDVQNALHGDIALLGKEDVLVLFSKSGETKELLQFLPFARERGTFIIAVVSSDKSRLVKEADMSLTLPFRKELCPFNLAPTTSSTTQLIFGDILVAYLMHMNRFTEEDYNRNHPSGTIGKKTSLLVEDLMKKEVPICKKEDLILNVLHELSSKKCGCIVALSKDKKLDGIFTDGDLRRAIESDKENFFKKRVGDYMTYNPKWIRRNELAHKALKQMEESRKVTVLPVLDQDKVVGIIHMHDIIEAGLI